VGGAGAAPDASIAARVLRMSYTSRWGVRGPRRARWAFTLVELLVVVGIIALLVTILVPSLARSTELARRTLCMTRLGGIARGIQIYAADYRGFIIPCRYRNVQICLNPKVGHDGEDAIDWVKAAASVGLDMGPAWECPSRPASCEWEDWFPQLMLGYQYFGGIEQWRNPYWRSPFKSRSPCNVNESRPEWILAADCMMKIDQIWGGGRPTAYGNMPQHRWRDAWPEGGNEVRIDGSAFWVKFEDTYFIHSWGTWNRMCYFYQKDLGEYDPPRDARGHP